MTAETMMKWRHKLPLLAALFAGISAQAEVVAWWRFDTIGADRKVVNAANPGTYDGYLTTGTAPSNGTWPAAAANMPVVTNSFQQVAPRMIDQQTGIVTNGGKALLWNGTAVKGGVVVPYEDAKDLLLEKFTIEAFVRLPPEAASRSNKMFPIVQFGNDSGPGYMFSAWDDSMSKGYLFWRSTGSNWTQWRDHAAQMPGLYDGRWHHVAVTFNGNLSTQKATAILYVDGNPFAKYTDYEWQGWDTEREKKYPLVIGWHPYQSTRTYMGEIAEVRISDTVLSDNEFLVPLADRPGLVDDDTALMITFDAAKSSGYGFAAQHLVPCINSSATNYVWNAKHWNVQNAAYSTPLVPCWFSFSDIKGRDTYLGDALRPLPDESVLPGGSLYGNAFATTADAEGASLKISRNNGSWADLISVPGGSALIADDLTMELFFKTDIANNDTDTLVYSGFLKWCVYQGKLLARTFTRAGQNSGSDPVQITSPQNVNDGEWHHVAYVYDKANGAVSLYVDYKLVGTKSATPWVDGNLACLIGGESRTYQVFNGNIDDVRITRRVLRPWEFLTTHVAGVDRLMDAPLEIDYSTGVDETIAPTGTTGVLVGTAASGEPSYPEIVKVREGFVTLDGVAGLETRASGHALHLEGGYVRWPFNRLLDKTELTVEFFARLDKLEHSANLVRLSDGTGWGNAPVWTLWHGTDRDPPSDIRITANTTTNGGITVRSSTSVFHHGSEVDGKWHHWAITIGTDATGSNTVFALYKDYERHGNAVTIEGVLRFPANGANLSVGGTGVAGGFTHGLVNNLRISPGVLSTDDFMRFIPKDGTAVIVR